MNTFRPIPEYPEYSISPLGQVRSERSGLILSHDLRGKVSLRNSASGKRPSCFIGELLAKAGLLQTGEAAGNAPEPQAPEAAPERSPKKAPASKAAGKAQEMSALEFMDDAVKDGLQRMETLRSENARITEQAADLEKSLGQARRVNGHLMALVATLRARIEVSGNQTASVKAKKSRQSGAEHTPSRDGDVLDPRDFELL